MESVFEGMAEFYSAELSQKVKRGMDINASKCLSTGGIAALGFKVNSQRKFEIDEDNAYIVRKIFNMYADGYKMGEIIDYLNSKGYKTSMGNAFNKGSLYKILTNKKYIGIYTHCGRQTKDGVPRIISDELFNKVQVEMEKNKKAPARKNIFLLTTKLFCGECGALMTGTSGNGYSKKYHYYTCKNNRIKQCDKKSLSQGYVENLVVCETKNILTNENIDIISKEIVKLYNQQSNTALLKELKSKLKKNEKAILNLIKAIEDGNDSSVTIILTNQIAEKKKEQETIKMEIVKEEAKLAKITVSEVKFFLNKFKKGDVNDLVYRSSLIDTFINEVHLNKDSAKILYNIKEEPSPNINDSNSSSKITMVEVSGVEPLSENSFL